MNEINRFLESHMREVTIQDAMFNYEMFGDVMVCHDGQVVAWEVEW